MYDYAPIWRKTRKPTGPEAAIADVVAAWLKHLDFTVVSELNRSHSVADIAALDTNDLVWIVEVKVGGDYNHAIKQLLRGSAHYRYIAKPVTKLLECTRGKLEGYGVGLIFIDGNECWIEIPARPESMTKAARKRITDRIREKVAGKEN
jgi:hypothetical protein